jgi:putative inorganic carbon (hco3(-)) transporter
MILFYLLVGIMPLSQHPIWGRMMGEFTVFKYVGAACLLYAVFHLGVRRALPPYFRMWQGRLFAILYLIASISYFTKTKLTLWEVNPLLSYSSFLLLFFITVAVVDSLSRLRCVVLAAIGSVAFASLYVIREWQKYHTAYAGFRPGWVVGDPNYFTISALLCLPLAFYLFQASRVSWERWFCLGCLAVTLLGVTLGASRGGFLGLVTAFLFVMWRSRRRVRSLALVAALVLPLSLAAPASPIGRLLHPRHSDEEAEAARIALWHAGLRMIRAHPLVGVGLANFKFYLTQYETAEEQQEQHTYTHNTYIHIASEIGLPALLVFLAILGFSYWTLERVQQRTRRSGPQFLHHVALGIQGGLLGSAVANFFVSGQYQKLLWLMVFLSICLPSLVPSERKRGKKTEDMPIGSRVPALALEKRCCMAPHQLASPLGLSSARADRDPASKSLPSLE